MSLLASIFLHFEIPDPTTWFYFALVLGVALFFKFSRLLSLRNWDVVTLFLLVPGFLLIKEGRSHPPIPATPPANSVQAAGDSAEPQPANSNHLLWLGYVWLLAGSIYFLVRCFIDLTLVRRPGLSPNLNLSGLAWLGGTLLVCLAAVAFQQLAQPQEVIGKESPALQKIKEAPEQAVARINQERGGSSDPVLDRRLAERSLATLCHLAIVTALVLIGGLHFHDVTAGMAAAAFYLLLPYTAYNFGQVHHVWPMALMLWAVVGYRLPLLAGIFLGLAAGSVYFPLFVAPLWLSFYWRRGGGRFAGAFLLAAGASLVIIGMGSFQSALALPEWQAWRMPSTEGFWTEFHWAYRVPVFIAYLALVAATALWPAPKNLAHVLALSAALLIGIQFWYADRGGVYVLWYLPLLVLLVFRPNLSERRPREIPPETDWLARLGRALGRLGGRLMKLPQPPVRVT